MYTRDRLVECDVCGELRNRRDIGPTMTYDPETNTYTDVLRCRDRRACHPRRTAPEDDGRVVRRGGLLVVR